MFAFVSTKPVWYLLACSSILFLFCSSVGFWFGGQKPIISERYPESLRAIFSTETIDALSQDPRLHDALFSLTEAIARSSTDLGKRFNSEGLRSFGTNLTDGVGHVRSKFQLDVKRRDLLDDISGAFGDLMGIGGAGLNLTGGLTGILGSLGDSIAGSLGTPALFLGIGLGMGTTTGLNLTDMEEADAIASRIATAYNSSATGANLAAQQLGSGLSQQVIPSFGSNDTSLGQAAFALASGIGNATAVGLGLTQQRFEPNPDSSIEGVAGNFGLGVAMPIVSNIDFQALMRSLGNSSSASKLMQQLPRIAAAAGIGLGKGARNGLGLKADDDNKENSGRVQRRQSRNDTASSGNNVPRAVKLFAKGLSQSFIQGSNFSTLNSAVGAAFPNSLDLRAMLGSLAAGAGAGIGTGAAIGFNFKPVDTTPTIAGNITKDEQQTALAAEAFTQNLLSNFLVNSSAIQKAKQFIVDGPSQAFKGVDGAKAAEGFARGTIEGVMSAMSSVGGLKNLISGDVPADAFENVPVLSPTQFNDSVNGAAVGFARGLTGKATILVAAIARNFTQGSQGSGDTIPGRKRSIGTGIEEASVVELDLLSTRQTQQPGGGQLPLAIDPATAQMGAQKLIDSVTCHGVGGIASAALGIMSTSKPETKMMDIAMGNTGVALDPIVLQALPRGPITISSEGNMFEIVIESQSVKINGQALMPFAVITGLHVIFAGLAFLTFLPLYLVLGVVWRFSVLTGHPIDEAKNKKWRMGFLITFAIFGIAGIILGMVGMGSASHFRDTHGIWIMGLICLIILFPTVGFSVVRLRTALPHPAPSAFAGIKGPIALAKSSQRIYLISGISSQLLLGLGQFAFLQGFATLRAISLCVVDAVLTSTSVAGLVSIVLMLQISATALVGIRAWLEQHIAKREAAGATATLPYGMKKHSRSDTIATFGFDRKEPPPALNLNSTRPSVFSRKTEELKGAEDNGISTPFNFRKEGSINEQEPREDPFLSPEERLNYQERGIYNPKTGGYSYAAPTSGPDSDYYNMAATYGERRPSSGIFDPQLSPRPPIVVTGPKTNNVSTMDLWPPPMPDADRLYMTQKTQKTVSSRYSRPIDGNVPVRDSFMGFGN